MKGDVRQIATFNQKLVTGASGGIYWPIVSTFWDIISFFIVRFYSSIIAEDFKHKNKIRIRKIELKMCGWYEIRN